jgi:hypothetical protein
VIPDQVDAGRHPIVDPEYVDRCRRQLDRDGALVLPGFFTDGAIREVVAESAHRCDEAFYAASSHNVYLTPTDPALPDDHPFNRQVDSSKGLIADDQIPASSPLRAVYDSDAFRTFLCGVLGIDRLHPYADDLSSINVHFASQGQELGWHFDNSSFAVTMLLQAPEGGGVFEYVRDARAADCGEMGYERVAAVLDGDEAAERLDIAPGDLVLFRGRDALHRVTPTEGSTIRMLVVFAYNGEPGVALSESALETFYGRTA